MHWKHLKLSIKFTIGFGIVLLLLLIVGWRAITGIGGIVDNAKEVIDGNALRAEMMQREVDHLNWAAQVSALLTNEKVTRLDVQTDPHRCAFGQWFYSEARKQAEEMLPELKPLLMEIEDPHKILHLSAIEVDEKFKTYVAGGEGAEEAKKEANRIYIDRTLVSLRKVQDTLGRIRSTVDEHVMTDQQMLHSADSTRQTVFLIGSVALVFGILIAVLIARGIIAPMKEGIHFARELSEGDLSATISVNQDDEVGRLAKALTQMAQRLRDIVGEVTSASDNVASGSEELSATAQELSQGATEQASSAEQVSSSMEEMTANIQQNSDNAHQTEKISSQSSIDATESGKAVQETLSAMKEITEKITIVQEIARQTNLLALNAAIEAARAGEHGKGFAVVASEVRKLAERSQKSAGEITELAKNSVGVAEKAGQMLEQLVPNIQKTADLVHEITAASNEQNSGAQQINKAIRQLDKVIQQNAGSAEEMASTSEELSSQAQTLQSAISFFKLGDTQAYSDPVSSPTYRSDPEPYKPATPKQPAFTKKAPAGALYQHSGDHYNEDGYQDADDQEDDRFERF